MAGAELLDLDHHGVGSRRDQDGDPDPRFRGNFREDGMDPHSRLYSPDSGYWQNMKGVDWIPTQSEKTK